VSHVKPALIGVAPPRLDQPPCLGQGGEPVDVEALVPERSIEAFDEAILLRLAGAREVHSDLVMICPEVHDLAGKFTAIAHWEPMFRRS